MVINKVSRDPRKEDKVDKAAKARELVDRILNNSREANTVNSKTRRAQKAAVGVTRGITKRSCTLSSSDSK